MSITRQHRVLLISGGTLMTALLIIMTIAPSSPAIYGFFVVAPAIGLGVLGAARATGQAVDRFGGGAALVAAAGGVAVVLVGAYAIATDQFTTTAGVGGDDPLAIPFMVTSMAWMIGSLAFAIALVRRRAIRVRGAWLVLVGTVLALVLGTILETVAPAISPLSALLFGIGWVVVAMDLRTAA